MGGGDGMRRRLSPEDVQQSGHVWRSGRKTGVWLVCDDYKLSGGRIVSAFDSDLFANLKYHWNAYRPLEEAPDLILKFSRLHQEQNFEEAALAFSRRYGLPDGPHDRDPYSYYVAVGIDELEVSRFRGESRRAWVTLALYEAVLNGDVGAVRRLIYDSRDDRFLGEWRWYLDTVSDDDRFALGIGLRACVTATQEVVGRFCRQTLVPVLSSNSNVDFSCVDVRWDFDNLLGAMYLQLWWLIASEGNITRCDYCGQMISLARTYPEGRKRRRDKRFCDDACRQANHRSKTKSLFGKGEG